MLSARTGAWVATCSHNLGRIQRQGLGSSHGTAGERLASRGWFRRLQSERPLVADDGRRLPALGSGHLAEGTAVSGPGGCFSPDGRFVAVGDTPGAIRLVETDSGVDVVRLERLKNAPDASVLYAGRNPADRRWSRYPRCTCGTCVNSDAVWLKSASTGTHRRIRRQR